MAPRIKMKALLIDLSGTLHIDNTLIPGAIEAIERLRETNLKLRFVTNTTKESLSALHLRLTRLGLRIARDEIFTSLSAARRLVDRRSLRPMLLLQKEAMEDFSGVDTLQPNAVLVGLSPEHFNYETLNQAFRLVLEGAALIAVHKARYLRRADGLALGPGAFVTGLEFSTGRTAEVVGKPQAQFFHAALEGLDCRPEEALMIGDDVRDDVAGAQAAGMRGVLVRTGKYRSGDEASVSPAPWHVADSLLDAVHFLFSGDSVYSAD